MKWNQYVIRTTTAAEDLIVALLSDLGIEGVEIRDRQEILDADTKDLFEDVMPKLLPDDGRAEVVFYLEEGVDETPVVSGVLEGLAALRGAVDVGEGTVLRSVTEDEDWANNWKAYFHAFYVDDILIKPTWAERPEGSEGKLTIEIDPGSAFGTGAHETTKLCLHALKKWLKPGDRVLDVGTGSGILSIAALKLGAGHAFGTDIDEMAVETAKENRAVNGIPEADFEVAAGNILSEKTVQDAVGYYCYDLVVSNILADVIIPLQEEIVRHMKPGGILNVSGIINLKADAVKQAILKNPALTLLETKTLGEWVSYTAKRTG